MDDSMKNYVQKVKDMRTAQKNYFRTGDKYIMFEAKRLEKHVDLLSEQLLAPTLFG